MRGCGFRGNTTSTLCTRNARPSVEWPTRVCINTQQKQWEQSSGDSDLVVLLETVNRVGIKTFKSVANVCSHYVYTQRRRTRAEANARKTCGKTSPSKEYGRDRVTDYQQYGVVVHENFWKFVVRVHETHFLIAFDFKTLLAHILFRFYDDKEKLIEHNNVQSTIFLTWVYCIVSGGLCVRACVLVSH